MIVLKFGCIEFTSSGCTTIFADNRKWSAQPHHTPHYHVIAHRCGYGDDLLRYAQEHDFCHLFVAERLRERPSVVLHALAHGREPDPGEGLYEEMAAQTFQRWLRANERPILGGFDWDALKSEALSHLQGEHP
jgi:hypothetical protein